MWSPAWSTSLAHAFSFIDDDSPRPFATPCAPRHVGLSSDPPRPDTPTRHPRQDTAYVITPSGKLRACPALKRSKRSCGALFDARPPARTPIRRMKLLIIRDHLRLRNNSRSQFTRFRSGVWTRSDLITSPATPKCVMDAVWTEIIRPGSYFHDDIRRTCCPEIANFRPGSAHSRSPRHLGVTQRHGAHCKVAAIDLRALFSTRLACRSGTAPTTVPESVVRRALSHRDNDLDQFGGPHETEFARPNPNHSGLCLGANLGKHASAPYQPRGGSEAYVISSPSVARRLFDGKVQRLFRMLEPPVEPAGPPRLSAVTWICPRTR